jgi:hypothetical protein
MDALLDVIGTADGARKQFDQWVLDARAAGLQPNMVQRLKRQKVVYTEIDANGVNWIVRGQRPEQG